MPNLSGIRALPTVEVAESKSKRKGSTWSHSQGVYFSGGLFALLIGGVLSGFTISYALKLDVEVEGVKEVEESLEEIDNLDIGQTWQLWSDVMDDQSLGEWQESQVEINRRWRRALFILATPCLILAISGLGCMIFSMKKPRQSGKPVRKPPQK